MNQNIENNVSAEGERPPVRIGIVGLGRAALMEHLPELRQMAGKFRLVAVCDLLKERRDMIEAEFPGVRMYRRVDDMLDDPEIDLIDIASRSPDHVKHVMASLRHNRWTLVESPMAMSHDEAMMIRAADVKAKGRLIVRQMGAFRPDFMTARSVLDDPRLGEVYDVRIRCEDFVRRDDWQSVKRCGGGAAFYACPDLVYQALALLRMPAVQLWSELKRVASLGDAEDYAHIVLKTRGAATADIVYSGAELASGGPSFEIRGERGVFSVRPGARVGTLHVVDPGFKFPRRRSSVRTPPLCDMHESVPMKDIPVECPAEPGNTGAAAFWNAVYGTVRTASPFPVSLDEAVEPIRILTLVKNSSPFAK